MAPPQAKYNGQSQEEFMSTTQDRMVPQNGSANYDAPGIGFSAAPKVACHLWLKSLIFLQLLNTDNRNASCLFLRSMSFCSLLCT